MIGCLLVVAFGLVLGAFILLNHPKFGRSPEGARLDTLRKSANFEDGEFKNLIDTPKFTKDVSTFSILRDDLLDPQERLVPDRPVPSVKTDLTTLDPNDDVVVWLGHSSYFVQLGGKRVLIDPVFSDHAAPLSFLNKAFPGTNVYRAEDMPGIDVLLVSHDHWDHLDHATVMALKDKVQHVVCPLGVGAHFAGWGYAEEQIHEADWHEQVVLEDGFAVHVLPARHYSGRSFRQNKTLWAGFALESPTRRLFFSGDSGYGPHFAEIGRRFGGFDLVALDCGQYDDRWAYLHMTPEEAVKAARDLNASAVIPSHVGRFTIARHAWDEPFQRMAAASEGEGYRLLTPILGEPVDLANGQQPFTFWWKPVGSSLVEKIVDS